MPTPMSRRTFTATTAAATLAVSATTSSAFGANERIRLGMIGVGNRGGQLLDALLQHKDCEIAAVCDVYEPYIARAKEKIGGAVTAYRDFRKLLEDNQLDGIVVATPDHWHAIQTIAACNAGKDVYVEKPLSITIVEGRKMVEAARRNQRVVQVGTHRRSSALYADATGLIRDNKLGKVTVSRAYRLSNMYPTGIGKAPPGQAPSNLDWDLWLGPRPERPFQQTIAPYKFRWWDLYSSQMANWGVHYLDAIRWLTGEQAPSAISALGGKFAIDDDRTVPDTMEAAFEFASGRLAIFGQYEASGAPAIKRGEIEFRGTQGTMYIDERSYEIVPERGGQFQDNKPRMAPVERSSSEGDLTVLHTRNFLDCMRSRKEPNADVEIGHRSTTMSLLANMSLAVKQRLEWDAETERIANVPAANDLLHYEYRKPWKLE
jgi:predicted dehydrogenase